MSDNDPIDIDDAIDDLRAAFNRLPKGDPPGALYVDGVTLLWAPRAGRYFPAEPKPSRPTTTAALRADDTEHRRHPAPAPPHWTPKPDRGG